MNLLSPELVCELPVFAASGLVISSGEFFIISDDEVTLLHGTPGNFRSIDLWDQVLPEDPAERKKVKPDFESLYLNGEKLFIVPSFSKKNRIRGALVEIRSMSQEILDLTRVRENFEAKIPDLNIEGAVMKNGKLHLFQRGNGKRGTNSIIICDDLHSEHFDVRELKLPAHKGVPLTVTDAALKGTRIYFSAVAENTDSTYLDGEVVGSFLGCLDEDLKLLSLKEIDLKGKPEGLAFQSETLYFVTDDDSREKPSRLFRLRDY